MQVPPPKNDQKIQFNRGSFATTAKKVKRKTKDEQMNHQSCLF